MPDPTGSSRGPAEPRTDARTCELIATFLALLKAVHRFDLAQETEFGAFATPTITGELRRHFRDHGWLVRPPRELQDRRQAVASARALLAQRLGREPGPMVDDAIILRAALARLPPRERAMVALRFDAGLSQVEIAEAMGMSPMQVSRALRRTLRLLRDELEPAGVLPT